MLYRRLTQLSPWSPLLVVQQQAQPFLGEAFSAAGAVSQSAVLLGAGQGPAGSVLLQFSYRSRQWSAVHSRVASFILVHKLWEGGPH